MSSPRQLKNFVGGAYVAPETDETTDIVHPSTGQVVAKVVSLASELEDSLVKLLVQAAPPEQAHKVEQSLHGPVVNPEGRTDVVANQSEVDDLLASLGF